MPFFKNLNITQIKDHLILLDIDGTLINDDNHELDDQTIEMIQQLKKENQVYLCSNSRNHERNLKVAELAKAEYIHTDLRKPDKKILDLIDHSKFEKKLVIGDKFLTDGLFAKNIGAEFLKVKRITSGKDRVYIRFLYWIDDFVGRIFFA